MTIYFAQLPQRGTLLIDGPDRSTFLQGQTTCDVAALSDQHAVAGAYCTPQGRVVCDFRILSCTDDSWLLQMDRGICDHAAATFAKYIVFSKAEISNASEQWATFGIWSDNPGELKNRHASGLHSQWRDGDACWVQTDTEGRRFECMVPAQRAEQFAAQLEKDMNLASAAEWALLEISAGIGHIERETIEEFIPQMLNYQVTDRISFTKGCYTGQEVVARMHYRGKLKRPMYLASLDRTHAPTAGTPLFSPDSEQSVGNIVNAAPLGEGSMVLAVIASSALDNGVHLGSQDGPLLEPVELPYSLEDS